MDFFLFRHIGLIFFGIIFENKNQTDKGKLLQISLIYIEFDKNYV